MADTEDWKQRYRKEAREWEATDGLLRRVLGRLAIAAEGSSGELDAVLARMQRHARDHEDRALEADLKDLTTQVRRLDSSNRAAAAPESAPAAVVAETGPSEKEYSEALIDALDVSAESGVALREFRRRLSSLEPEQCLAELAVQISSLLRQEPQTDGGVQEVLLTIIDEVSVAQPGVGAMDTLRETLQRDKDSDWHRVLERVVGEIRSLIQRISSEKQALEQLVQDVSAELGEISEVLVEERGNLDSGRDQALALHDIMHEGVQRIQQHIDTESDIEKLKAGVSHSLEGIRSGISDFVARDEARFAEAQARNEELQERIGRMESEAGELRKKLARNRDKLMHDTLTGVRSRLAYDETLAQEMSRYRRYHEAFSLAVLDIDHFKRVNDDYGHTAGDKALKLVAELMQGRIRESDFLFRTGGEEFVVLLPKTGISGARPLVEDIREAVGESGFHYESQPVPITLSAGLTQVRDDDTAETLFNRADDAMYRAKKGGRDRLVVLE